MGALAMVFQGQIEGPDGIVGVLWCGMVLMVPAQFLMALVALVQVLRREAPTEQRILWGAVSWFIPIIGPILWWTIASDQVGRGPGPRG